MCAAAMAAAGPRRRPGRRASTVVSEAKPKAKTQKYFNENINTKPAGRVSGDFDLGYLRFAWWTAGRAARAAAAGER